MVAMSPKDISTILVAATTPTAPLHRRIWRPYAPNFPPPAGKFTLKNERTGAFSPPQQWCHWKSSWNRTINERMQQTPNRLIWRSPVRRIWESYGIRRQNAEDPNDNSRFQNLLDLLTYVKSMGLRYRNPQSFELLFEAHLTRATIAGAFHLWAAETVL